MTGLLKQTVRVAALYFALCLGTMLMALSIIRYTAFNDHTGFLNFKQEYLHIGIWKAAFYVHVFSSGFTLLAGFTQFSRGLMRAYPRFHRWLGRLYVADVLFLNVPAAFIMAVYANGGLSSKIAFLLLDLLWAFFTIQAWRKGINRDFVAHKRFMIRSYALTLSALCLRSWKLFFVSYTSLDAGTIYQLDAWLGFLPNLLVAEWIIRNSRVSAGNLYSPRRLNPTTSGPSTQEKLQTK
jgi:uncharacterized membrane protein